DSYFIKLTAALRKALTTGPRQNEGLRKQHCAPPRWAGRGRWPLGHLGLAARPDQVVRTVLVFDQAGVDDSRERGVIQRHRQIFPPSLAGFFPRCADVI